MGVMGAIQKKVREALLAVAADPADVEARYRRRSGIKTYNRIQYMKLVVGAGLSGLGGWVVGTVLTAGATASLLRCVANMTYAYGFSLGAVVEKEDFFGALGVWLGKMPEDAVGRATGLVKTSRAAAIAVRGAQPVIEKVGGEIFIKIARPFQDYLVERLAARIVVKMATNIVPVLSGLVLIVLVTRDYDNLKTAIRKYYKQKLRMSA